MACCNEHSRAELLRRGIAQAGSGLPAIEAGMPTPAGTGLDRRTFLARSLGLALAVYGGSALRPQAYEEGIAAAAAAANANGKVLVSVFLDGGADALSVLYPADDPPTALCGHASRCRPRRGRRSPRIRRLYWHPPSRPLAELHGEGKVNVMPGIGYDHPNQSHFTSRHFWEVGAADERLGTGWLGRYLDRVGSPDNPLQGLSLDWSLQPSLATAKMPVAAVDAPDRYDFWARGVWGDIAERMIDTIGRLGLASDQRRSGPATGNRCRPPVGPAVRPADPVQAEGRQEELHEPGRVSGRRRRVPTPPRRPGRDARRRASTPRRGADGSWRLRHP